MAVVSIKLQKERASNKDNKYGCTREYQVAFDAPNAGSFAAMTASISGGDAIPAYGAVHPGNAGINVSSIEAELVSDSLRHYKVTVEYTPPESDQGNDPTVSPLDEPADISYGATGGTEAYFKDRSSAKKPVTNSAGEPFDNVPERDNDEMTITIVRNEATINPDTFESLKNTTNSNTVVIDGFAYPADTLKLRMPTAAKATGSYVNNSGHTVTVNYYKVTYSYMYRAAGWKQMFLDYGYKEVLSDSKPHEIQVDGKAITKPWPLDGAGHRKTNLTDAAAELTYQPYASANHGQLNFS